MKVNLFLLFCTCCFFVVAQQSQTNLDSIQSLDEVIIKTSSIFGNKYVAENRTGASYYLGATELKKYGYVDINRVLKAVPGVSFYEEDGFGLRPNISLRGTSPERSAKISLMEDGVLIAPAPYSAPSAYYFPSVGRMQAVEILKGSSQVQYGPFTSGGAINMVSTEIPEEFKGNILASYGTFDTSRLHANVGGSKQHFGYMLEFLNYNSDGFKNLLNDFNTGFDINELVAKVAYKTKTDLKTEHRVELKFQYYDELSNETYLGLTNNDFAQSPFNRYASSQVDNMDADHLQLQLTHTLNIGKNIRVTTDAYINNFARNWYKLDDVVFNGEKEKIGKLLADDDAYQDYLSIIRGSVDSENDALLVKANNREYTSRGIQTKFDYHFNGEAAFHDIEVGLRYHYDEEDRYQWEDGYNIIDQVMTKTSDGLRGAEGNRISSATAFSSYITYKLKYKKWTFTPGVRYENIFLERLDYGSNDPDRTGIDRSDRSNNVNVLIPGLGFNYKFTNDVSVFGGIHKGFSPPSNQPGEEAESSINYELGSRFKLGKLQGELIGFYNDYDNLLGSDLAATGGTGSLDQFNAGAVRVSGLELLLNYELLPTKKNLSLPITFGYTLTNTEFLTSFGSEDDLWGEVNIGDELPYIPTHQFNAAVSLEHEMFQFNLSGRYNGAFRTQAGQGTILTDELVANNFIVDISVKYFINSKFTASANIINLLDERYAVSRVPAGLRPGHPFGSYLGLEYRF